jgi:hypothetical protein
MGLVIGALHRHESPHPRPESPLAGTARQGRGRAVPRSRMQERGVIALQRHGTLWQAQQYPDRMAPAWSS